MHSHFMLDMKCAHQWVPGKRSIQTSGDFVPKKALSSQLLRVLSHSWHWTSDRQMSIEGLIYLSTNTQIHMGTLRLRVTPSMDGFWYSSFVILLIAALGTQLSSAPWIFPAFRIKSNLCYLGRKQDSQESQAASATGFARRHNWKMVWWGPCDVHQPLSLPHRYAGPGSQEHAYPSAWLCVASQIWKLYLISFCQWPVIQSWGLMLVSTGG